MLKWCCVKFLANKETIALGQLERQGYRVFCPRIVKTVSHARKRTEKHVPFFPTYLFVQIEPETQLWTPINGTHGVVSIVQAGGQPAWVRPTFVENLINSADETGLVSFNERFVVGDKVRAISGPFDRLVGTLVEMKDTERVTVLMSMLGREVNVTVPRRQLIAAV